MARPLLLTIAGSDSGAGAGLQADARVCHALGGYAATVVTAVTAQNTHGVQAWQAIAVPLLRAQLEAVFSDLPVKAVKTGLLPSAQAVEVVAQFAQRYAHLPWVVDPVLGSTSGTAFLNAAGQAKLLRRLAPHITLLTPNWPELARLAQRPVASVEQAAEAARQLSETYGVRALLVKGGHSGEPLCRDLLVTREGSRVEFAGYRHDTPNTHGTGCVLASAIAQGLASGRSLVAAIEQAKRFVDLVLLRGAEQQWGTTPQSRGPAFAGW